ncbi:hypothetical protein ACFQ46_15745 [Kineococcus sp. GCM10028916]|uniref:hypothetical protein n=1 Tax=Kineococcus sp. GCM10028916 TaxID=3273394 RepID=UPI0036429023
MTTGPLPVQEIHGFNYAGSWGTSGLDLWQHHDHGLMAVEVSRGKAAFPGWNTARWWLSHEAHQRHPERFLANFEAGLGIFAAHGIAVVPVLFNRWRDPVCDFGGVPLDHLLPHASAWTRTDDLFADAAADGPDVAAVQRLFRRYLVDVVSAHADDARIRLWDLCNEPLMGAYVHDERSPLRIAELRWLTWCREVVLASGARQPLTVGNYAEVAALRATEPLSDVLGFHPYWMWQGIGPETGVHTHEGFESYLDECVGFARSVGKELYASETVWGARDDAKHVEVMRYTLSRLAERGIGYTVHALHHSGVADLHRDSHGPVGHPEWLHFLDADGSLRPGHEAFNDFGPAPDRG